VTRRRQHHSGQSQPNVYLIEITDGKIGMKTL